MCDDYFLTYETGIEDFFDEPTQTFKIYEERDRKTMKGTASKKPAAHDAAFRNANQLIDIYYGETRANKGGDRFFVPHKPHFFFKSLFHVFPPLAKASLLRTQNNQFRSMDDLYTAYFYNNFVADSGNFRVERIATHDIPPSLDDPTFTVYMRSKDHKEHDSTLKQLEGLIGAKRKGEEGYGMPKFVAINDAAVGKVDSPQWPQLLEGFYDELYPEKSPVELYDLEY